MNTLINLRKRKQLTLKELSKGLNNLSDISFDENQLWKFEKGEDVPTEEEAEILGQYFNVPYHSFLHYH